MPTLFRFHGLLNSIDFQNCSALGIFFDIKGFSLSFNEVDENGFETNLIGCGTTYLSA